MDLEVGCLGRYLNATRCCTLIQKAIFCIGLVLVSGQNVHGNEAEDQLLEVVVGLKLSLSKSSSFLDQGNIYSAGELQNSRLAFKNEALHTAGLEVLRSLSENRYLYESLPFDKWTKVTGALLDLDDWSSSRVAWGNLVIKCYLIDYILRAIYVRVRDITFPNKQELLTYKNYTSRLRSHIPTKLSGFVVAKQAHGVGVVNKPDGLTYGHLSSKAQMVRLADKAQREINSIVSLPRLDDKVYEWVLSETKVEVKTYLALYSNELVWTLADNMSHKLLLWDLTAYICSKQFLVYNKKDNDFSFIGGDFSSFLVACSKNEDGAWFSEGLIEYFENPKLDPLHYKDKFLSSKGRGILSKIWDEEKAIFHSPYVNSLT